MTVACTSEMLLPVYQTIRCHNSQDPVFWNLAQISQNFLPLNSVTSLRAALPYVLRRCPVRISVGALDMQTDFFRTFASASKDMAGYCRSASVQEGYTHRMETTITPDVTYMSAELLQEEECDMEVYLRATWKYTSLLSYSWNYLCLVSRPGRFIPRKWEAKKIKSSLSLSKYHSRKKTWDVEIYFLALVFP